MNSQENGIDQSMSTFIGTSIWIYFIIILGWLVSKHNFWHSSTASTSMKFS